MAIIAQYALKNPIIQKLVSTQYYTMSFINGKYTNLKNTNPLLSFYQGITGMKTGYTGLAGKCLVASAKRDGLEIIVVTLGEPSSKLRISDTVKILDYCFENYKMYDLRELYPINFSINVKKAIQNSFIPVYSEGVYLPLSEDEKESIKIKKYIDKDLIAPINANKNIGKVQFKIGEDVLGEVELSTPHKIERINLAQYYGIVLGTFLDFEKYIY
jgi:D-alanyl-D-alanine carboxypeptidase (penicillin-binding protein 5/6)